MDGIMHCYGTQSCDKFSNVTCKRSKENWEERNATEITGAVRNDFRENKMVAIIQSRYHSEHMSLVELKKRESAMKKNSIQRQELANELRFRDQQFAHHRNDLIIRIFWLC